MTKYRKKPVEVEAIQWRGSNLKEILEFSSEAYIDKDNYTLKIHTLEGEMIANRGDYIIKGIEGEFYPCKQDIFEKTYDEVIELSEQDRQDILKASIERDKYFGY